MSYTAEEMRLYMRRSRAFAKEGAAIMVLPPRQRMDAYRQLVDRDHDLIMEHGGKLHLGLLRRIEEAPDAYVPFWKQPRTFEPGHCAYCGGKFGVDFNTLGVIDDKPACRACWEDRA